VTDPDRDDYLREALRHAPDAQVQPPTALSALILNEARTKARDAKPPARPARIPLLGLWDWLARPSVAAGFAGLMAATLVGVMWWDQPMDPALPRRPAPATAPVAAPSVASAPGVAPAQAPIAEAERRAAEPPHVVLRKAAPAADKAAVAPAASPPPPAPAAAARDELAANSQSGAAQPAREATPVTAMALPPPKLPAPAEQAAPDTAVTAGALAKSKSADDAKRARSSDAPKAELSELRVQQDASTRSSLVRLRAAVAAEPARWAWQRDDGSAQSMNDNVSAWLAQLDAATGSTWQPRNAHDTAAPLGRGLRLMRDGRLLHSLLVTEHGVLWQSEQSAWQAGLPTDTLARLQTALDAAAP